jgi:hypothetical protein
MQAEIVAQHIQQRCRRLDIDRVCTAIHVQLDAHVRSPAPATIKAPPAMLVISASVVVAYGAAMKLTLLLPPPTLTLAQPEGT